MLQHIHSHIYIIILSRSSLTMTQIRPIHLESQDGPAETQSTQRFVYSTILDAPFSPPLRNYYPILTISNPAISPPSPPQKTVSPRGLKSSEMPHSPKKTTPQSNGSSLPPYIPSYIEDYSVLPGKAIILLEVSVCLFRADRGAFGRI